MRKQPGPVGRALAVGCALGCSNSVATPPVDGGAAGAPADAVCVVVDQHPGERQACSFGAGARVSETIGDVRPLRRAIDHVIVVVHENHSVDNVFGVTGQGIEGLPAGASNPDAGGTPVPAFHLPGLCTSDLGHGFGQMHDQYDDGKMDGFVRVAGPTAMGYHDDADHPFFTYLALKFAFGDHAFASVLGPTWPNRDYLFAGTSDGIMDTGSSALHARNLFDALDDAGIPWTDYWNGADPPFQTDLGIPLTHPKIRPFAELAPALASGRLDPVVYIDSGEDLYDEHPGTSGVDQGERFMAELVAELFASPLWPHLALIFTYDESGGFYDHVPPPSACLAAPSETAFDRLGFRVPLMVVSPYSRPGFISHEVHSLTSITRFIEALFDLPALTGRDATSDALLDLFDFCQPAFATPPSDVPEPTQVVSECP